jgi:hypothetical protein
MNEGKPKRVLYVLCLYTGIDSDAFKDWIERTARTSWTRLSELTRLAFKEDGQQQDSDQFRRRTQNTDMVLDSSEARQFRGDQ